MTKNKIKLLSLFGAIAIIGTASAAWVFTKDAADSYSISTTLEGYSQQGKVTVTDKGSEVKLNLDQGDNSSNGITWKNGTGSDEGISAKYTSDATIDESKIERTWTLTLSSGLLEYVGYPSLTSSYQNVAWTDDAIITLPQLVWQSNKKPTDLAAYNAMKDKLSSFTVSITFNVKLKS